MTHNNQRTGDDRPFFVIGFLAAAGGLENEGRKDGAQSGCCHSILVAMLSHPKESAQGDVEPVRWVVTGNLDLRVKNPFPSEPGYIRLGSVGATVPLEVLEEKEEKIVALLLQIFQGQLELQAARRCLCGGA